MEQRMKHFIVGPVEMYQCTKDIYNDEYLYFRTPEFGEMVKDNLSKLSKLLGNSTENSLIYLTASGSAAMEAVVDNCVSADDKSLVINGGTFGKRFCDLLDFHSKNYDSINLSFGEKLTKEHLDKYNNKGYTMLFVNLHETSVGQLYDIEMLSDFCKRNNMLLVVDAISTFLADEYDMDKYGIDATIISSQKGLCLSPGLSFISFSKRMLNKITNSEAKYKYFDFKDYFKNIERGQTPYTPAVMIMYEMKAMLEYIENIGGKEQLLAKIENKCMSFRRRIENTGLTIPQTYTLSNMLTPVMCDGVDATELVKLLRDRYKLCVNPCGGALSNKMFRVSHIGDTNIEDYEDLADKIILLFNELKNRELVYDRK